MGLLTLTCVVSGLLTSGRALAEPGPVVPAEYVALGDSYTSGPNIPLQTGLPLGCQRSNRDYPMLVNSVLRVARFRDVSCSGATTTQMSASQAVAGGSNPAQLDALSAATSLVSLGIGGNDIGFIGVVKNCATRSSKKPLGAACQDYYHRSGRDELTERIAATAPKVAATLRSIARRAPAAKVLVVGYPTILPDSGPGCFPAIPFSAGDVAYLRQTEQRLNAMLAAQARQAGVEFVDTYRPSVGHDVCTLPGTKWVEGLVATSPAAPVHPNALGMRNSANAVLSALHVSLLATAR